MHSLHLVRDPYRSKHDSIHLDEPKHEEEALPGDMGGGPLPGDMGGGPRGGGGRGELGGGAVLYVYI